MSIKHRNWMSRTISKKSFKKQIIYILFKKIPKSVKKKFTKEFLKSNKKKYKNIKIVI